MEGKTMKRIMLFISLLWALFISMPLQAQTINQKGVTYQYNGKNKRTPIGGVYIKPITAANGVVSDESNGTFTLALDNLKMGSRIGNVRVTKQSMMVFNQQAVDEWSVRKDPLCLILCDADEFQKQKKNLIAIGESQAKKKYDKKLAELKKQNDAQQLQIDDYYNKLDSLDKEYQNALKHMDEYADVFARIDESEVDTVAQRAIEMFNRGEIEESIHLLEQQNYMEKIKQANRTIEQADAMISTAEQAKSLAEQDKEKSIEGVKTQIAGYKLQNEWGKAKELLKGLADNLNTLESIEEYAVFCTEQHFFMEAESYFVKELTILSEDSNNLTTVTKYDIMASIQNNLALLYRLTGRYEKSEASFLNALNFCKGLVDVNPIFYEKKIANIQTNLGVLYLSNMRVLEAETMLKSSLEILERITKTDSTESELALTRMYLAELYVANMRFSEAESMLKSSLEILKPMEEFGSTAIQHQLTITQKGLADLYKYTMRYSEAETMYQSALEISEYLAKVNPLRYETSLALLYTGLAELYKDIQDFPKSRINYKYAINIYERLAKSIPSTVKPVMSGTLSGYANLLKDMHLYSEALSAYESALDIQKTLFILYPSVYGIPLATTKVGIAELYQITGKISESEALYKSAIECYEGIKDFNSPEALYQCLAEAQRKYADLLYLEQRYSESEVMYKSAIEKLKRNRQVLNPELAIAQYNLCVLYFNTNRHVECETMCNECMEEYNLLYEKNPSMYVGNVNAIYYLLGRTFLSIGKYDEAKTQFIQSLSLSRQMIKDGKETNIYKESLSYLADISAYERNYTSAYTFHKELLSLIEQLFITDGIDKGEYASIKTNLSFFANLLCKFKEGELYALEALKVDSTQHMAYTNLAAALLLQGKVEEAEKLYIQYKAELKDGFLSDFAEFERLGVIPEERKKDVERIKAILKEE